MLVIGCNTARPGFYPLEIKRLRNDQLLQGHLVHDAIRARIDGFLWWFGSGS